MNGYCIPTSKQQLYSYRFYLSFPWFCKGYSESLQHGFLYSFKNGIGFCKLIAKKCVNYFCLKYTIKDCSLARRDDNKIIHLQETTEKAYMSTAM